MNIPNILTVSRIILTAFFALAMQFPGVAGALTGLLLFLLASLTDLLDGYIARKYHLITPFGKIMDPIADKCLTLTAFFMLSSKGMLALWMVGIIAFREIAVTVVRLHALKTGRVLPAESSGKIKTVFQIGTLVLALLAVVLDACTPAAGGVKDFASFLRLAVNTIMIVTVILTVWSGIKFFEGMKTGRHQEIP